MRRREKTFGYSIRTRRETSQKIEIFLIFFLGYGDRGAPPKIPGKELRFNYLLFKIFLLAGGATLIFEVELLRIERKQDL